ncbi:hypothetical protein EDB87DRAFT_1578147 [Lactarius vividus]|nr:hypothetical protein EDB87DRAFT_1578147 [Lactarius vividus]
MAWVARSYYTMKAMLWQAEVDRGLLTQVCFRVGKRAEDRRRRGASPEKHVTTRSKIIIRSQGRARSISISLRPAVSMSPRLGRFGYPAPRGEKRKQLPHGQQSAGCWAGLGWAGWARRKTIWVPGTNCKPRGQTPPRSLRLFRAAPDGRARLWQKLSALFEIRLYSSVGTSDLGRDVSNIPLVPVRVCGALENAENRLQ